MWWRCASSNRFYARHMVRACSNYVLLRWRSLCTPPDGPDSRMCPLRGIPRRGGTCLASCGVCICGCPWVCTSAASVDAREVLGSGDAFRPGGQACQGSRVCWVLAPAAFWPACCVLWLCRYVLWEAGRSRKQDGVVGWHEDRGGGWRQLRRGAGDDV